jgi:hypothetical protein
VCVCVCVCVCTGYVCAEDPILHSIFFKPYLDSMKVNLLAGSGKLRNASCPLSCTRRGPEFRLRNVVLRASVLPVCTALGESGF